MLQLQGQKKYLFSKEKDYLCSNEDGPKGTWQVTLSSLFVRDNNLVLILLIAVYGVAWMRLVRHGFLWFTYYQAISTRPRWKTNMTIFKWKHLLLVQPQPHNASTDIYQKQRTDCSLLLIVKINNCSASLCSSLVLSAALHPVYCSIGQTTHNPKYIE